MMRTPGGSAFLSWLLLTNLLRAQPLEQQPAPAAAPALFINIVEGEGTLNNIKQRVNREPIVQVEDENHKPIAGAAVVFFSYIGFDAVSTAFLPASSHEVLLTPTTSTILYTPSELFFAIAASFCGDDVRAC